MSESFKLNLVFQNETPIAHEKRESTTFENVKQWSVKNQEQDSYRIIEVELVDGNVYTFFENDQFELIKSQVIKTTTAINEVRGEMVRQVVKWGQQNHVSYTPQGVLESQDPLSSELAKVICDLKAKHCVISWTDIFLEEVFEAIDEAKAGDLEKLRTELVQCAAVAVSWIESIDRNQK